MTDPRESAVRDLLLRQMDDAAFRANFEHAGVGMMQLDLDAKVIRANQAVCDMLGYTQAELIGRSLEPITHPDDLAQSRMFRSGMKSGSADTLRIQKRYLRKNGSVVWANVNAALVHDDLGAPAYFIATVEDVSERKAVEAELRASESKFSSMFNLAPSAMTIATLGGRVLDVNASFVDLFGFSREEVLGHPVSELGVWADLADRQSIINSVAAYGAVRNVEALRRRKDGAIFPSLVSANVVEVEGDTFVLSITQDITEQVLREAALQESEARAQAMFNEAPLGYQSLDEDGRVIEVNPAWLTTLGYERNDVLGEWFGTFLAPEYVAAFRERFELFKSLGTIHSEFEMMHKDGSRHFIAFEGRVEVNPNGCFKQTHCILSDITERVRAEQELRRERELYQATFDYAAVGIAQVSSQGRWLKVNRTLSDILGYSPEEFERLSFADITHPDDVGRTAAALPPMRDESQDTYRTEKRYLRKDGATVWADVSVAAIRDQDGSLDYLVTVVQDITSRKHAETQLAKSFSSLIEVIGRVTETRDAYTAGHQRRVAELSVAIAEQMGIPEAEIEEIHNAALVHDIGKMSVPAEILSKPGGLLSIEFEIIKAHSKAGYDILKSSDMPGNVAEIVYQHHERCDGSGYPRGLTADQLLPASKVLMVADVVEAMSTHRPYRAALGIGPALAEIELGAGSRYDAVVADACRRVCCEDGFEFSAQ